jgi:hypothetical protein
MCMCIEKSFPPDTAELVSIRPGRDFFVLDMFWSNSFTHTSFTAPSFVGKKREVYCQQRVVYCVQRSVLCSTICVQLHVLWLFRNVSTDDLRASHAVLPVPSGKVKDEVVRIKSVELIRLGTY